MFNSMVMAPSLMFSIKERLFFRLEKGYFKRWQGRNKIISYKHTNANIIINDALKVIAERKLVFDVFKLKINIFS